MHQHGLMLNNMPELPEVETVINILKPLVIGKTIKNCDIFYDRLIQSDLNEFKINIQNKTIKDITRYGKYIFFHLSDNYVLISHLRMEGKYRYLTEYKRIAFTTLMFNFTDNTFLSYDDTRKFGIMYLTKENEYKDLEMIKKLGIEANKVTLDDFDYLKSKYHKNKKMKELLLDQSILAGIGNIYADEILYASKINPLTKGKDLTDEDIKNIIINAKIILEKAIKEGGSTIHSFHPSEGVDGKFQASLQAYGKEGEICPHCGTTFHKIFIGGRGTTFCPNCQINKDLEKAIGITGPISSGKSTVLSHFKDKGYLAISSDEEVHNLYKDPEVIKKMSRILNIDFNYYNERQRQLAKSIMINDSSKKKKVEEYIYQLLENKLIEYINNNDLIAIEVPLLFKAHYEYLFKKIIVLSVTDQKQIENFKSRNENDINSSKKLNNDYSYDKANKKISIIENNGDFACLFEKIDKIID